MFSSIVLFTTYWLSIGLVSTLFCIAYGSFIRWLGPTKIINDIEWNLWVVFYSPFGIFSVVTGMALLGWVPWSVWGAEFAVFFFAWGFMIYASMDKKKSKNLRHKKSIADLVRAIGRLSALTQVNKIRNLGKNLQWAVKWIFLH